jgi:hypothetical protein
MAVLVHGRCGARLCATDDMDRGTMYLRIALYVGIAAATIGGLSSGVACKADDAGVAGAAASGAGASHAGGGGADRQGGSGGSLFASTGGSAGSTGQGGGCAGTRIVAERRPLDIYLMLDQSGSMTDPVSGGTKWDAVSAAIATFVQQPAALGIGVGLQYFPLKVASVCPTSCATNADCGVCGPCFLGNGPGLCMNVGTDSCLATDYATPEVPIEALPAAAAATLTSLLWHVPAGATPTSAALQGAVDYATTWAAANPDHVTIVLLATDGDPTECDTDLNHINAIAATASAGSPPVLTFVIGVGSSLSALNGIAAAGETSAAFLVDTSEDVTLQFLAALNNIQAQALGCTYTIPQPSQGDLNYEQVNVEYTPGGGGAVDAFPKVSDLAACPPNSDGWYYDDNALPEEIILCPATCDKVSADLGGRIDIVLGCDSILRSLHVP